MRLPRDDDAQRAVTGVAAARDGRPLERRHAGGTGLVGVGPDTTIGSPTARD